MEPGSVDHALFLCDLEGKKWKENDSYSWKLLVMEEQQISVGWWALTWEVMLMEPETSMQKSSKGSAVRGFSSGWSKNRSSRYPGKASSGELEELLRS